MVYSKKLKFIFIANPKTGSRSVTKTLQKWDDEWVFNCRPINREGDQIRKDATVHIMPYKLKELMGEIYDHFKIFVFIRSPYGRAVSTYFYYQNGGPYNQMLKKGYRKLSLRYISATINYNFTRMLPFSLYSLLKPLKTNYQYIADKNGKIIVDFIGKTESLNSDLVEIGKVLGLETEAPDKVEKINQSSHDSEVMSYFKKGWHLKLFRLRYKKEIEIYDLICSKPASHNWRNQFISK